MHENCLQLKKILKDFTIPIQEIMVVIIISFYDLD